MTERLAVSSYSSIANPGIQERIEKIDAEVYQYIDSGYQENSPLYDRVITANDRCDDQRPQTGNVEYLLYYYGPS
jgi:hypothetical protein